jgi:hypothetical protein
MEEEEVAELGTMAEVESERKTQEEEEAKMEKMTVGVATAKKTEEEEEDARKTERGMVNNELRHLQTWARQKSTQELPTWKRVVAWERPRVEYSRRGGAPRYSSDLEHRGECVLPRCRHRSSDVRGIQRDRHPNHCHLA